MKRLLYKAFSLFICTALIVCAAPYAPAVSASRFYDTAELLSILSHIENDAEMGTYATVQGGCTDGQNAYFAVQSGNTVILKYSLSTWELRKKATVGGLGHANDMAYNPNKKMIVVANNDSEDDRLTMVDPETLKVVGSVTPKAQKTQKEIKEEAKKKKISESKVEKYKDLKLYSIAYNPKRGVYIAGLSGSYDYVYLDESFEQIESVKGYSSGLTRQGCDCDDDYIYFAQSGGSNAVVIYDYSGNMVDTVSLNHSHEVENLFHIGNSFYLTLHYYGNSVQRVGLSDKTKICFNIKYNAGGGQGEMADTTVHYGEDTKLRKCSFVKPGYSFGGWTLQRTSDAKRIGSRLGSDKTEWLDSSELYNDVLYKDEQKVSKLTKFGDVLLTPFWINESYGIYYDSDGGEGWMTPETVEYSEEYALPANAFSRHGYVFSGYTARRDADGRVYGYVSGSNQPEWLERDDAESLYYFEEGEVVSQMTYDLAVTFTARFTYAFSFSKYMDVLEKYVGVDEKVDVPDVGGRLKRIASGAFEGNTEMRTLKLPASVTKIESGAVTDCPNLEDICFEERFPREFSLDCVIDSGTPMVYIERDGVQLCLGFYADRHDAPILICNALEFEKNYGELTGSRVTE